MLRALPTQKRSICPGLLCHSGFPGARTHLTVGHQSPSLSNQCQSWWCTNPSCTLFHIFMPLLVSSSELTTRTSFLNVPLGLGEGTFACVLGVTWCVLRACMLRACCMCAMCVLRACIQVLCGSQKTTQVSPHSPYLNQDLLLFATGLGLGLGLRVRVSL